MKLRWQQLEILTCSETPGKLPDGPQAGDRLLQCIAALCGAMLILLVPIEGIFFMALSAWFSAGPQATKTRVIRMPPATCRSNPNS